MIVSFQVTVSRDDNGEAGEVAHDKRRRTFPATR
jgi:hypothetical protein